MDTDFARQQMVDQQVRAWEVLDPGVLQVLKDVPREQFVPTGYEALAFADTAIPIGHGEEMMTPTLEGRVLQALNPGSGDKILEVGTGTGFLAACFARLAASVTSIDIHEDLLERARVNLEDTGIDNVSLHKRHAPKDLPNEKNQHEPVSGSFMHIDKRFY